MIQFDDMENESEEYKAFIEKFKPKKTTDDCYTPQNIYKAVLDFVVEEYGLQGREVMRPFYPGGDYEHEKYPENCVVIDNPPFSILSKICGFYERKGVDYFLFAPALTLFSINSGKSNYIISDSDITYENGANVRTGFTTNMGKYKIQTRPDLHRIIKEQNDKNAKSTKELPKYAYPNELVSSAALGKIARYTTLKITSEDCTFTRALESQREKKKTIYGGGFLLKASAAAEKTVAEKTAAEKTAAHKWELSGNELEFVNG